jgi:hypothetical protein
MFDIQLEMKRERQEQTLLALRALRIARKVCSFYPELLEWLKNERKEWNIYDFVIVRHYSGVFQEETENIKCYVDQNCGWSGDDYSGHIYYDLNGKLFLKVSF